MGTQIPNQRTFARSRPVLPIREKDQTACKPGSVHHVNADWRPFLCDDDCSSPDATDPESDAKTRHHAFPIWSCSRRGLPCQFCCQNRGALLPHPFTLTPTYRGGLLSVALSLGSRRAGVTRRPVLMEPGLSSSMQACQRPPGHLIRRGL